MKQRCLETAIEMRKKKKKKRGRKRHRLNRIIQLMRRVVEWTENARIDQEKGRRIKRWKRGMKLLRESNTVRWLDIPVGEIEDLAVVEEKAEVYLDRLLVEREEEDERQWRAERSVEILRETKEEDVFL